jgi:AraC-like DNA-binding protein
MNNSPLHRIQHWPQLAHEAKYSVKALAKACGVSVRVLERLFLPALGDTPRRWLKRLRMERAVELLRDGSSIKETAACLGYEDPSHFSREFKKNYGFAPKGCASSPAKAPPTPRMSHSAMKMSHLAMNS